MPRGSKPGERRGGRKAGTKNRASIARQEQVASSGATPLDVMLENMRFAHEQAAEVLGKIMTLEPPAEGEASGEGIDAFRELLRFRQIAEDCAKDAAPYVHPRLASVEHKGNKDNPIALLLQSIDGTTRGLPGKGKS